MLGPLEVIDRRGVVRVQGAKPRALLTVLLLNANKPVSADRLAVALWGEDVPPNAIRTVHVHISRLRKALAEEDILTTTPSGYRLRVRPGELDIERFESLVADGRRDLAAGHVERAAATLREALGLWRGPPLEDLPDDPLAQSEITRLEEERLAALEARVQADLAAGRHAELLGELRQLAAAAPLRERLTGHLMLALYRCGRQSEALDVYARTRALLCDEFGLEPAPELRELQRDILGQSATLDVHGPAAAAPLSGARDPARPFALPPVLDAAGEEDVFVGRAAELDALAEVFAQASGGRRRLVLVHGEPGIGKTRLAAEFARRAHEAGAVVLYGRCDEEALLAQQPFVEALRHYVSACPAQELRARLQHASGELRRILPELADRVPELPAPLEGDPEGARSRLFEAVASLLCEAAQREPVILVLDDLHWADKATVLLLKYLARYPRQAQLMVLGTYRDTEVDADDPLFAMLTELGREHHLDRHSLTSLDPAAVAELVTVHTGDKATADLCRTVYEGTEGNAFFVVEVLRHLAEAGASGEPFSGAAAGSLGVPDSVKDVIGRRIARLGPQTNRLLAAASVLGHHFDLQVLERLAPLQEDELVDALEAAVRASVIEEVAGPAGRYAFSHALIRDTVYGKLTATRRAILHRRAGSAIEEAYATDLDPHLSALAHHYAQAGPSGLDQAIEYGRRAAEYATSQLAYEQAAAQLRRTVELVEAVDLGRRQGLRCDLVTAQGEAERQAGDPAYRATLLGAARLARELDDPERLARAALANNRGISSSGQGIDRERVAVLRAAVDAYDSTDSPTRAALLALLAVELSTGNDLRLHDALSDQAVAMARRLGEPRTLALVLTQSRVSQWSPTQTPEERRANLREAAALADHLNDRLLGGHIAFLAAHAAMNVGDLEESDRHVARLSAAAEQLAQPVLRWYDAVARAKRRVISGPADEAERLAYAALDIGRRTGQPDSEMWFLGQVIAARFLQGALDRRDPHLPSLIPVAGSSLPSSPEITPSPAMPLLVGAAMSLILSEVGRLEEARAHFDLLMDTGLRDLPPNYLALVIPVYASVACARLGDTRRAERLHAILEPERHRLVTTGASWFGATTHYLGLLAATLDRCDEAEERFADAERTYGALGAEPWLVRLRNDRIAAHLATPSAGALGRPDLLAGVDEPHRLAGR